MTMEKTEKRKRNDLSISDKIRMIEMIRDGMKQKEVAEIFSVSKQAVSDIYRHQEGILEAYEILGPDCSKQHKRSTYLKRLPEIDDFVFCHFIAEGNFSKMNSTLLRSRVKEVAMERKNNLIEQKRKRNVMSKETKDNGFLHFEISDYWVSKMVDRIFAAKRAQELHLPKDKMAKDGLMYDGYDTNEETYVKVPMEQEDVLTDAEDCRSGILARTSIDSDILGRKSVQAKLNSSMDPTCDSLDLENQEDEDSLCTLPCSHEEDSLGSSSIEDISSTLDVVDQLVQFLQDYNMQQRIKEKNGVDLSLLVNFQHHLQEFVSQDQE